MKCVMAILLSLYLNAGAKSIGQAKKYQYDEFLSRNGYQKVDNSFYYNVTEKSVYESDDIFGSIEFRIATTSNDTLILMTEVTNCKSYTAVNTRIETYFRGILVTDNIINQSFVMQKGSVISLIDNTIRSKRFVTQMRKFYAKLENTIVSEYEFENSSARRADTVFSIGDQKVTINGYLTKNIGDVRTGVITTRIYGILCDKLQYFPMGTYEMRYTGKNYIDDPMRIYDFSENRYPNQLHKICSEKAFD